MSSYRSDGLTITYDERKGAEPTLILIHGWTNNRTVWKPVVEHLTHGSIALDLRGHGESDKPDDEAAYAIERFTSDISALLDHERIGGEPRTASAEQPASFLRARARK